MRILMTTIGFCMVLFLGTGCVGGPQPASAMVPPAATGKDWVKKAAALPGFLRINGLLNDSNNIVVQRQIAADNGRTSIMVNIQYTDLDKLKSFDQSSTLQTVFDLGTSILQLAPDTSSTNSAAGPVALQELFQTLNATWVLKIGGALHKAKSLEEAQIKTIQGVQGFLSLLQKFQSFQSTQFQEPLAENIRQLLEDQLTTTAMKQTNTLNISVSLDAIMAAYLSAYLNGNFVDRWGTTLSQPNMTQLGNDTVATVAKVALEAVFDYAMMTPIMHDASQPNTNKIPTFAVIFPQLYEGISANPDAPGITAPENEAIKYLSGLGGEEAKDLSALIVKSLGGASVGVKVSTGDNSTFAQFISTFCEEFFRRNTEEFTYDLLEKFQYRPTTTNSLLGYEPNKDVNDAQLAELKSLYPLDQPFQEAVVAALVSQDELKALAQGGWKLSASNITNYQAFASKLLGSGAPATNVFSKLPTSLQQELKSKSYLDSQLQQELIASLDQLIETNNGNIYDPSRYPELLSLDTKAVLRSSRNSQPLQWLQHLNTLLLLDAFGRNSALPQK